MCEAVENYGKKKKEEGRVEGREEGRVEGREEGRVEGREEGRVEGREEILRDVANSVIPLFKKKTLSLEDACGITKMTEEEFLALVAKN